MTETESLNDKWLCAESFSSTGRLESDEWTSSEKVRLAAALTKCNPIKPNWDSVSKLMNTQPQAKHRASGFFSPNNCLTQFQKIHRNYVRQNCSGDTERFCRRSFAADHLISVLATEALLEKSKLLGKNTPAVQSRSVTPHNQGFCSDGSRRVSSTSSTLEIIPDTIFEDAVQYASPAESLADDYFHLSGMNKSNIPKPVLTGPTRIARKSTPKMVERTGGTSAEIRHFADLHAKPGAFVEIKGNNRKNQPTRKSQRMPPSSTSASSKTIGRKMKTTGISEISERLATSASALASKSNSAVAKNEEKTHKKTKNAKVCLSFGVEGNTKIFTLTQLQEENKARRELRSSSRLITEQISRESGRAGTSASVVTTPFIETPSIATIDNTASNTSTPSRSFSIVTRQRSIKNKAIKYLRGYVPLTSLSELKDGNQIPSKTPELDSLQSESNTSGDKVNSITETDYPTQIIDNDEENDNIPAYHYEDDMSITYISQMSPERGINVSPLPADSTHELGSIPSSLSLVDVEEDVSTVPQEELMFLFRQVLGFTQTEFFCSSSTGFPGGNNRAIKMPMDLGKILELLQAGEITTVAALERHLMLAYSQAIFVHNERHRISKAAHAAVQALRRLLSEYSSRQFLQERCSQFNGHGLIVLQQDLNHFKRPQSPDITELPTRPKRKKKV